MPTLQIDSSSTGDPARHLSGETLKLKLEQLSPAPKDSGTVTLMVSCREEGRRELPDEVVLTPADGMPGDTWGRNPDPNPVSQLAVMQTAVAELIANGQPLPLFGDSQPGACLPDCLGAVDTIFVGKGTCSDGFKCAPCNGPFGGSTGACDFLP